MARTKADNSIFGQLEKGNTPDYYNMSVAQLIEGITDIYSKYQTLKGEKISIADLKKVLNSASNTQKQLNDIIVAFEKKES